MKTKLLAVLLLLTGCATQPQYYNSHKSDQEWNADVAYCQSTSWGANGIYQRSTFDYCMQGRGWVRAN